LRQSNAVSSLFKEKILLPPENLSSTILGYLFFREKLLEMVLGDSEINILYWVGKELGSSMEVKVMEEIEDIFSQLDLGQVHLEQQYGSLIHFRITHNRFNLVPKKRLEKSLTLEAGLIAGIMEKVTGCYCAANVQVKEKEGTFATVEVVLDECTNVV
jgi:predicted hydrocarbon binding protein